MQFFYVSWTTPLDHLCSTFLPWVAGDGWCEPHICLRNAYKNHWKPNNARQQEIIWCCWTLWLDVMRQRPHITGWPMGCQSSWSSFWGTAHSHGPAAAQLSHPIIPGPGIRAENCWAQSGQQLGTCFCAAQLPALGDLVLFLLGAAVDGSWDHRGFQGILLCTSWDEAWFHWVWGVSVNIQWYFLCVCILMNMMVSFHYNKKSFPKYFFL